MYSKINESCPVFWFWTMSNKETIFGPKNYVNDFPYQFKNVCGRINEMSKRLKNQQTLRLSI